MGIVVYDRERLINLLNILIILCDYNRTFCKQIVINSTTANTCFIGYKWKERLSFGRGPCRWRELLQTTANTCSNCNGPSYRHILAIVNAITLPTPRNPSVKATDYPLFWSIMGALPLWGADNHKRDLQINSIFVIILVVKGCIYFVLRHQRPSNLCWYSSFRIWTWIYWFFPSKKLHHFLYTCLLVYQGARNVVKKEKPREGFYFNLKLFYLRYIAVENDATHVNTW